MFGTPASQKRAHQLENSVNKQRPTGRDGFQPAADPFASGSMTKFNLTNPPSIHYGRVVDTVPHAHAYKVHVEGASTTITCCEMVHTSLLPMGARQLCTYAPGTAVYLLWHQQSPSGVIIGACPDYKYDARHGTSDFIVQASRVGLKVDLVNSFPLLMADNGNVTDWSAGRPCDSVTVGEWGAMTETGLGVFLDPFMAFMRVDEATGLFVFYHDQLARLAGYNLQVRSAGAEREDLDDQNEYSNYEGYASYLWEAKGRSALGLETHREFTAAEQQNTKQHYSRFEPLVDDQQPVHRLMTFHGYLGQIESRFAILPPGGDGPYRYSTPHVLPGVFEEHVGQTGRFTSRSLKGYTIGKTALIAVPKRMCRPEDAAGDSFLNYNFAGKVDDPGLPDEEIPPLHFIKGELPLPEDLEFPGDEGTIRAAALMDQLAYQFNWEGLHPFYYHEKDWYLPEEGELPYYSVGVTPSFADLATNQFIPVPPVINLTVDHRHAANFYATEAFLHFAEEGSIILADGYGFELRTSQGNAYLSLPGDLWLQVGKNCNVWAGWDIILRTLNSIDLSATKNDVRIKAEQNIMALAGNSGCGGILLESRGLCPSSEGFETNVGEDVKFNGIILRAATAQIVTMAQHILISTNIRDYGGGEMFTAADAVETAKGEFVGGPVVIDAGPGIDGHIVTYCDIFHRHLGKAAVDVFAGASAGAPDYRVNEYWRDRTYIDSPLDVNGQMAGSGGVYAGGGIQSRGEVTGNADGLDAVIGAITGRRTSLGAYAASAKQEGRSMIEEAKLSYAEFSFRLPQHYRTVGLRLYEVRWHQLARLAGQILPPWDEKFSQQIGKIDPEDQTYPHPGREPWTGEGDTLCYVQQDLALYDPATDSKANRNDLDDDGMNPYEVAEIVAPVPVVMKDNYPMIQT